MKEITIPCPVCDGKTQDWNELKLFGEIDSKNYTCVNCQILFRHPAPDDIFLKNYYSKKYFRYGDRIEKACAQAQGHWILKHCHAQNINIAQAFFIEIGGGRGWLSHYMKTKGVGDHICIEPDADSVHWGTENLGVSFVNETIGGDIDIKKLVGHQAIVIIALSHVLEHLPNPANILENLDIPNKDIWLFLEVPNGKVEQKIILLDRFWGGQDQHLWSFTDKSLEILISKTGYTLVRIEKLGNKKYWLTSEASLTLLSEMEDILNTCRNERGVKLTNMVKFTVMLFVKSSLLFLQAVMYRLVKFGHYKRTHLPVIRILARKR